MALAGCSQSSSPFVGERASIAHQPSGLEATPTPNDIRVESSDGVATFRGTLAAPGPMALAEPGPTTAPTPVPSSGDASTPAPSLASLVVALLSEVLPDYNRREWRHWVDADRDCQDARQEVLIAESVQPVIFTDAGQCRVASGQWVGPFTGTPVTDPGDLDIDHLVPLANAHKTGGHAWDAARKREYANYLQDPAHLVAVTARANRSKGAKGPEDWRPSDEGHWCQYAKDWVGVNVEWELTVTPAEVEALGEMLVTCR